MSCQHEDFVAVVTVGRIGGEDGDSPTWFTADVRVKCARCQQPFAFKGLPCGVSQTQPMVSADGLEARLPLASPAEIALSPAPGLYGMIGNVAEGSDDPSV